MEIKMSALLLISLIHGHRRLPSAAAQSQACSLPRHRYSRTIKGVPGCPSRWPASETLMTRSYRTESESLLRNAKWVAKVTVWVTLMPAVSESSHYNPSAHWAWYTDYKHGAIQHFSLYSCSLQCDFAAPLIRNLCLYSLIVGWTWDLF